MFCIKNILIAASLIFLLTGCHKTYYTLYKYAVNYKVTPCSGDSIGKTMALMVQHYSDSMQMRLADTIAYTAQPLTKAQPESTLGNLVADAVLSGARREVPKVCAAIIPIHSLALSYVAPGPVTRATCYDLLSHETRLMVVELSGRQLKTLCDTIARHKGWPVSGLTFVIDSNYSKEQRINGVAIHDQLLYAVAVSDYVVSERILGTNRQQVNKYYLQASLRAALIYYMEHNGKSGNVIQPQLSNRIYYAD